jgi:hypothetical protein
MRQPKLTRPTVELFSDGEILDVNMLNRRGARGCNDGTPLPAALVVEVTKATRIGAVEMGRGAIVDWQLAPRAGFCALSRAGVHEGVTVRSRRAGNFCRTAGACCRYLLLRCTWRQRGFGRGFVPLRVGQPNRHGSCKQRYGKCSQHGFFLP